MAIREQHRSIDGDFELATTRVIRGTIRGWRNRIYPLQAPLHSYCSIRWELPDASDSCQADAEPLAGGGLLAGDTFPDELLTPEDDFWLRATAHLTLSLTERLIWREMGGTQQRRREWLLGRIAAKDSVRHCLRTRYGRQWAAADIRIETGESGKPAPQGEWRRHCGAA